MKENSLRQEIGQKIRAARKQTGLSLRELSSLTGISHSYLGMLERGQRRANVEVLVRIIRALPINMDEIFPSLNADQLAHVRRMVEPKAERRHFGRAPDFQSIVLFSRYPTEEDLKAGHFSPGLVKDSLSRPEGLTDLYAFAISVKENSMKPRFRQRDILIVLPEIKLKDNIAVIYCLKNGNCGIRIYRQSEGGKVVLSNADLSEVRVFDSKDLVCIYPVVMSLKREY